MLSSREKNDMSVAVSMLVPKSALLPAFKAN
jgi:hypothetical protein